MVRKSNAKSSKSDGRRNQKRSPAGSRTNIISFRESDILQRWLLTTEGCPTCAQIKRDMKREFASGKIKATDVGDEKGFEILTTLGISEAPVFIIELTDEAEERTGCRYIIDE